MNPGETEKQAAQTTIRTNGNGVHHAQPQPTEVAQRSAMSKRYVLVPLGVIVAAAILFFGIKYLIYASAHQTTNDARIDANVVAVTSKINERVDRLMVDTDQPVKKGQLLVVLDNVDERAKVAQAQANLQQAIETQQATTQQGSGGVAQAQANVSDASAMVSAARAGVVAGQAQVSAAQAQLPAASQALIKARADLRRTQSLVSTGDLPAQQLDAAKATEAQAASQYRATSDQVNVALANLNAAEQKVSSAAAGVTAAQGGVTTAQGRLAQAQAPSSVAAQRAALEIAQQNLKNTRIYSPINGYVGEKNVEVGQTVSAGMNLLTLIPDKVFVTANFKETQVGNMHAGQPVDVTVDAYKGVTFHGRVLSLNPASQNTYALVPAQNSTGNFVKVTQRIPVKIAVDNPDPNRYPLRPGMSVEASVKVR